MKFMKFYGTVGHNPAQL